MNEQETIYARIHPSEPTERNPHRFHIIYAKSSEMGPWQRVMKNWKVASSPILTRPAVANEVDRYQRSWRMFSLRYKTWEELIFDEYLETKDMEWVQKLYEKSGLKESLLKIIKVDQPIEIKYGQLSIFDQ